MSPEPIRPSGPKVFGILSIVFASLTLVFTLLSGVVAIATQQMDQSRSWLHRGLPNPEERIEINKRFVQRTRPATVSQTFVFSLMSVALLVIGIGQLRYRGWARRLSVCWGALALVFLTLNGLLQLLIVRPAQQQMFAELQGLSGQGLDAAAYGMMGSFFSGPLMLVSMVIFYAPYPILLLAYFSRTTAKEAMVSE